MEAAGVELFNLLILNKLLVLQEARSAKKCSLPGRRYKNGTNGCDLTCTALAQSSTTKSRPTGWSLESSIPQFDHFPTASLGTNASNTRKVVRGGAALF